MKVNLEFDLDYYKGINELDFYYKYSRFEHVVSMIELDLMSIRNGHKKFDEKMQDEWEGLIYKARNPKEGDK